MGKPFSDEGGSPHSSWRFKHLAEENMNTQSNSTDCSIFACKAAESFGLGLKLRIRQRDLATVRDLMMVEMLQGECVPLRWPP